MRVSGLTKIAGLRHDTTCGSWARRIKEGLRPQKKVILGRSQMLGNNTDGCFFLKNNSNGVAVAPFEFILSQTDAKSHQEPV